MKKVIIIGAGFAGLTCAYKLAVKGKGLRPDISVINDKERFSFLPMLPDCLGRGVKAEFLTYGLKRISSKFKFNFIKGKVTRLDLAKKQVLTSNSVLDYDYLVVASGSETNFYGNNQIRQAAYKLDDAEDADSLRRAIDSKEYNSYLVAGAGYTGVEVASNLSVYLKRKGLEKKIIIIERAPSILGPLPDWMKNYVIFNLKRLGVNVLTETSVSRIENGIVSLSNGEVFNHTMLIWAAGVRAADFIQDLAVEKNTQGRIKVDKFLKFNESCFAIGDAGYFADKNNFLRMAVQFAITQGDCCADNIIRITKGSKLREYRPLDLGYVIPMANNKSCGRVMGINLKGIFPTLLHYLMCIYRAYGVKNRCGMINNLISGGVR